jgi:hypothetical protein
MTKIYFATLAVSIVLAWGCFRLALRQHIAGPSSLRPIPVPVNNRHAPYGRGRD